jgi:hypothetical protein
MRYDESRQFQGVSPQPSATSHQRLRTLRGMQSITELAPTKLKAEI